MKTKKKTNLVLANTCHCLVIFAQKNQRQHHLKPLMTTFHHKCINQCWAFLDFYEEPLILVQKI